MPCHALLDSGSQVTIVFDTWYTNNLSDVPIQPVAGLPIWGLSSSSYPYKGYIVIDIEFPASNTSVEESISILTLVYPESLGPQQEQMPVSFSSCLLFCSTIDDTKNAHTLRIQTHPTFPPPQSYRKPVTDQPEGKVKWVGPVTFTATVEPEKPLSKDIS